MAITGTNLTSNHLNIDQNSYTTASVTPSANALVLVKVVTERGSSIDPATPSLSGCGLTWVVEEDNLYDTGAANRARLTVFRAMGASPSAEAITIDYGGVTHTGCHWSVDEFTGDVDTTGTNGSGAIGQSVPGSGTATSGSISLTSPAGTSAIYGAFAHKANEATTFGTGFTELSDTFHGSPNGGTQCEWRADSVSTVDASWSTSSTWGGVGIEIKAAGAGGPQNIPITNAAETDSAQGLSFVKPIHKTLGVGTETDLARALSVTKTIFRSLVPATESDVARPIGASQPQFVSLTPVTETDAAQALSRAKRKTLIVVVEADAARPLSFIKPIHKSLVAATETDTAQPLGLPEMWVPVPRRSTTAVSRRSTAAVARRGA